METIRMNIVNNDVNKTNLSAFYIYGLFDRYNVFLSFDRTVNIYIGENGLGKTTILKCLYYVLKGKYYLLSAMPFLRISIEFLNEKCSITKNDIKENLNKVFQNIYGFLDEYYIKDNILDYLTRNDIDINDLINIKPSILSDLSKRISDKYGDSQAVIQRKLWELGRYANLVNFSSVKTKKSNKLSKFFEKVRNNIKDEIIYLPTFRRIESSFRYLEMDEYNDSLIHFGMGDVDKSIKSVLDKIREQTVINYNKMTGILLKEYLNNDNFIQDNSLSSIDINIAGIVLSRLEVEGKVESDYKTKIMNKIIDNSIYESKNNYLRNLLLHLIDNYKKLKLYDDKINNFVKTCNRYFEDKEIRYNPDKLDYSICIESHKKNKNTININELSSGEKQIVALFTLLYLCDENRSCNNKKIVLIDEPELSLSLKWQRLLIPDIMDSGNCSMLVAVTHSPFIFDNGYEMDVKEINRVREKNR